MELAQLKQKNREEARESLATSIVLRRTRQDAVLLANNYIQHLTALEQLVFRHMWSTLLLLAIYSLLVLSILRTEFTSAKLVFLLGALCLCVVLVALCVIDALVFSPQATLHTLNYTDIDIED